jgi:hypothetical protein
MAPPGTGAYPPSVSGAETDRRDSFPATSSVGLTMPALSGLPVCLPLQHARRPVSWSMSSENLDRAPARTIRPSARERARYRADPEEPIRGRGGAEGGHHADKRATSRKSPAFAGIFLCAQVDSNHHGEISPQGPQPCASTNSAMGAEGASIARGHRPRMAPAVDGACIRPRATLVCEHMFVPDHRQPERGAQ